MTATMTLINGTRTVQTPAVSTFAEARKYLDEWEKAEPDVSHIVLILDGRDTLVSIAGGEIRQSDAAGLCFAAAQMVLE